MEAVYHWVGVVTVWLLALATLFFGGCLIWDMIWFRRIKRRVGNAWLGFRILVLREPFRLTIGGCRNLIYLCGEKAWGADWWERNLAAYIIRQNRRLGYKSY